MRPIRTAPLTIGLLIPLLLGNACPAFAEEPAKPWRTLYNLCQKLSDEGDYVGALGACEQAYALNPEPGILAYIAQIQTALLHPVQAREALEKYLRSGPLDSADRKTAEAQIRYLDTQIGTLLVIAQLEGTEIRVDDQITDAGALARGVPLPAGAHQLNLKAKGVTHHRFIVLRGGERTQIELPGNGSIALTCAVPNTRFFIDGEAIDAAQAAHGVARTAGSHRVTFKGDATTWPEQVVTVNADERVAVVCTQPHSEQGERVNPRGYWVTGVGVALGVAALTTAIYNGSQYNRWETANDALRDDLKDNTVTLVEAAHRAQENDQLMDSIKTGRKVAVGLGVAGALVTTGGMLLLFSDSKPPNNKATNSWFRQVARGVNVSCAVNSGEVAWRGAW